MNFKLIGPSNYLRNLVFRPTFKEALQDYFPGRSQFSFYMVSALINADSDGKVVAATTIIGSSIGTGAILGGLTKVGAWTLERYGIWSAEKFALWSGRVQGAATLGAPLADAAVGIHKDREQSKEYNKAHPMIKAAKNQEELDKALGDAVCNDLQKAGDGVTKFVLDSADEKISLYRENLKDTKNPKEKIAYENAITKLEGVKRSLAHDNICQPNPSASVETSQTLPEIVVQSVR